MRELFARWEEARAHSDALFAVLSEEALYQRPIAERHRIVFYIGHLEAFDWNLLHEAMGGRTGNDADLDKLFAFGIDPLGGGLPDDQPTDWPRLARIRQYVAETRHKLDSGRGTYEMNRLLPVAIEHRLMHLETLAYMFHRLPFTQKRGTNSLGGAQEDLRPAMVEVPAGSVTLGLSSAGETFGWDNEFEAHVEIVPAFAIDKYKVTNGEFLAFVGAGGYQDRALWKPEDWDWKTRENITHPAFWTVTGAVPRYRGMFAESALPLASPVYVSHAEASAYARWAGKALPSEAQWQRASEGVRSLHGNFDFRNWDPTPVHAFPESASAWGAVEMYGNGWEWTSTVFAPFDGFKPFPFYPGYSANFFDGLHYVMKGASPRTASCMVRPSFRNWFQAHYPYVYAAFRCVSPAERERA